MLVGVDELGFLEAVLASEANRVVLERGPLLGVADWWLTGGAVFQAAWNRLDGRDPDAGVLDRDLFYFDPADLSWEAEDAVVQKAADLFSDLTSPLQVRNEARVHLWFADHFGVAAEPFSSTRDAIDHFASTTCCYGVTRRADGFEVYAPHGFADLAAGRVRPNPGPATREVYETKTARWHTEWPCLLVEPWPTGVP